MGDFASGNLASDSVSGSHSSPWVMDPGSSEHGIIGEDGQDSLWNSPRAPDPSKFGSLDEFAGSLALGNAENLLASYNNIQNNIRQESASSERVHLGNGEDGHRHQRLAPPSLSESQILASALQRALLGSNTFPESNSSSRAQDVLTIAVQSQAFQPSSNGIPSQASAQATPGDIWELLASQCGGGGAGGQADASLQLSPTSLLNLVDFPSQEASANCGDQPAPDHPTPAVHPTPQPEPSRARHQRSKSLPVVPLPPDALPPVAPSRHHQPPHTPPHHRGPPPGGPPLASRPVPTLSGVSNRRGASSSGAAGQSLRSRRGLPDLPSYPNRPNGQQQGQVFTGTPSTPSPKKRESEGPPAGTESYYSGRWQGQGSPIAKSPRSGGQLSPGSGLKAIPPSPTNGLSGDMARLAMNSARGGGVPRPVTPASPSGSRASGGPPLPIPRSPGAYNSAPPLAPARAAAGGGTLSSSPSDWQSGGGHSRGPAEHSSADSRGSSAMGSGSYSAAGHSACSAPNSVDQVSVARQGSDAHATAGQVESRAAAADGYWNAGAQGGLVAPAAGQLSPMGGMDMALAIAAVTGGMATQQQLRVAELEDDSDEGVGGGGLSADEEGGGDDSLAMSGSRQKHSTKPRSVAERLRRERIAVRLQRLKDVMPKTDARIDTSAMLEDAVVYIRSLQSRCRSLERQNALLAAKVAEVSRRGGGSAAAEAEYANLQQQLQLEAAGNALHSLMGLGQL